MTTTTTTLPTATSQAKCPPVIEISCSEEFVLVIDPRVGRKISNVHASPVHANGFSTIQKRKNGYMVLLHAFYGFMDHVSVNKSRERLFANSFQPPLAKRSCG
jgi:hypothetical protein